MTNITIDGIFVSTDLSYLITEQFAKTYHIDLDSWITPFGYFDEYNQSIISNTHIPDGIYILLGWVNYPGSSRMSSHTIYQFNVIQSRGLDLILHKPLNKYHNLPKNLPLSPKYPLFKVGDLPDYKEAKKAYSELHTQHLTLDNLKANIANIADQSSVKSKIYNLRLALQRRISSEDGILI